MSEPAAGRWPDLSLPMLAPTIEALHLWSQVVGKVRMGLTPWVNHSWHVPLYLSARGLTTGWIPTAAGALDLEFDLIDHALEMRTDDGARRTIPLTGQSVASFHAMMMAALAQLGVVVELDETPCEVANAIPFPQDRSVRGYDSDVARSYGRAPCSRSNACFSASGRALSVNAAPSTYSGAASIWP